MKKIILLFSLVFCAVQLSAGLSNIKEVRLIVEEAKFIQKETIEKEVYLQMKRYLPEVKVETFMGKGDDIETILYINILALETKVGTKFGICFTSEVSLYKYAQDSVLNMTGNNVFYFDSTIAITPQEEYEQYLLETLEEIIKSFAYKWNKDKDSKPMKLSDVQNKKLNNKK